MAGMSGLWQPGQEARKTSNMQRPQACNWGNQLNSVLKIDFGNWSNTFQSMLCVLFDWLIRDNSLPLSSETWPWFTFSPVCHQTCVHFYTNFYMKWLEISYYGILFNKITYICMIVSRIAVSRLLINLTFQLQVLIFQHLPWSRGHYVLKKKDCFNWI